MRFSVMQKSGLLAAFLIFTSIDLNAAASAVQDAALTVDTAAVAVAVVPGTAPGPAVEDLCIDAFCTTENSGQHDLDDIKARALSSGISNSETWLSLLHVQLGKPKISDPEFILSRQDFSPEMELERTIDRLYSGDETAVCLFPARYFLLRAQLAIPKLPIERCREIVEFFARAPADEIALAFASENVTQPSSIMGHSFIKISGYSKAQQKQVSHAISFYTDTATLNVPYLLYESLVLGKKGYFSLTPYDEKVSRYVDVEQRNLWEYELRLNEHEKRLILLHLIELKNVDLKYFFHDYNCATLIDFILRTTGRGGGEQGFWITPRDLIRNTERLGLVKGTNVIASQRWAFRALGAQVTNREIDAMKRGVVSGDIEKSIHRDSPADIQRTFLLLAAYNDFAVGEGTIDEDRWDLNRKQMDQLRSEADGGASLTVAERSSPANGPEDSQLTLRWVRREDANHIDLSFTPISHHLEDDNRTGGIENELILFEPRVSFSERGGIRLDRFILYSIQSMTPHDPFSGGLSGKFRIGVQRENGGDSGFRHYYSISGAIGKTLRPTSGVDLFLLAGAIAGVKSEPYTLGTLEAGSIIRQARNMKSVINFRREIGRKDGEPGGSYFHFFQSLYFNGDYTLQLEVQRRLKESNGENSFALGLKRLF